MNLPNSSLTHLPDGRILPAVLKLLFLRIRISYNSFRHAKLRTKIRNIIFGGLLLGFAYFFMSVSRWMLDLLRSPEFVQYAGLDLRGILASVPALTLTSLFVATLLTSFGVLLQALYLAGDMDFLLTTPVPIRAVFIAKLLQAVLPNFALFCLFGIPLLFGIGISYRYNFSYYLFTVLVMICLALGASGISSLLVMLTVRVLPPRRAAEILGFVGAMTGLLCSQLGNLANSLGRNINISGTRLAGILLISNIRWLPLNWAGQGLVAMGAGQWLSGSLLLVATFGFTFITFWFALVTAERWYYSGWARMQVVSRKKAIRPSQTERAASNGSRFRLARFLPKPVFAIIQKDFLTMRRDLRNLSQLVSPIVFGAIYALYLLRGNPNSPASAGEASGWFAESAHILRAYGNIGISLFVGWMLLSRLAGMGFSHEGRNYWMLKVAPIRVSYLLASKFLVAYLPALGLGLIFLTIISIVQKLSIVVFAYGLFAIIMCLAGMTGILLAFGVVGANFTWEDPRRMNAGGMGCLGQIISMLYLPISFGLFVVPLVVMNYMELPAVYGYLIGIILGSLVTAGFAFIPLWLVQKRVMQLGTE